MTGTELIIIVVLSLLLLGPEALLEVPWLLANQSDAWADRMLLGFGALLVVLQAVIAWQRQSVQ